MAERQRYPSLPANYVSIVDLQERWMKQQQEKQKEEEQQQQPQQELQQKLPEHEVKEKIAEATIVEHENQASTEANGKQNPKLKIQNSIDRRKRSRKSYRVKGRKEHRVVEVRNPKPEASEIQAAVAIACEIHGGGDQKAGESTGSKNLKKGRMKKENHLKEGNVKSRVTTNAVEVQALKSLKEVESATEKDILVSVGNGEVEAERQNAEGEVKILEEKNVADRTPEIVHKFGYVERNRDRSTEAGRRLHTIRRNGDVVAGPGWGLKGIPRIVPRAGEIGSRLKDLSVNSDSNGPTRGSFNGRRENVGRDRTTRSTSVTYDRGGRYGRNGGYRMFVGRNLGNKRVGSGLVWVRKGEASEAAEA